MVWITFNINECRPELPIGGLTAIAYNDEYKPTNYWLLKADRLYLVVMENSVMGRGAVTIPKVVRQERGKYVAELLDGKVLEMRVIPNKKKLSKFLEIPCKYRVEKNPSVIL